MGVVESLWRVVQTLFGRSMENPRRPLDPWSAALGDSVESSLASSGVRVNQERALTHTAWWRGVTLISGTVAKLPLGVYRRLPQGVELDPKHPAHRLLRRTPNEAMTPLVWKRTMTGHVLAKGNGYSYISRRADNTPVELWPLDPTRTNPVRENGRLWYVHELKSGEYRKLDPADVIHFKGYGYDGLIGYDVIAKAKEALGLGLAMQSFASIFFRNSARPNVILVHPGRLNDEARKNLRQSWERMHGGLENAHRTAILEEGMQAVELSINARDSQLLESRQLNLIDIANILGIPPHKLGAATNVSYKSLEQENQAYLDDSIDPHLVMMEEELESKLLGAYQRERETHCVSYDRFPLVRADLQQRGAYYVQAVSNGWMSPDDVRGREGLNPLPGGLGGVYYRPANLTPINADPDGPDGPAVSASARLLELPDLRQESDYDCGPAAVQSVCQYLEVGPTARADYVDALETTRRGGTRPGAILSLLSKLGLVATAAQELELPDLARFFAAGQPVLCPIQSGEGPTVGHWVAVTGTGLGCVFVQDPATGPRMLTEEDWLSRWRDTDADGVSYVRFGIAVGNDLLVAHTEAGPVEPDEQADSTPVENGQDANRAKALHQLCLVNLRDTMARMVRRLGTSARRAAKEPGSFLRYLDGMTDHQGVIEEALGPVVLALGHCTNREHATGDLSRQVIAEVRGRLLDVSGKVGPGQLCGAVEEAMTALETDVTRMDAYQTLTGEK